MTTATATPLPSVQLTLSQTAIGKLKQLIAEENNPALNLRVYITGGGCSGFQYGFTFDENLNDDDTRLEQGGVGLVVDATSYQYLAGAEIDYQDNLEGSQ